MGKRKTQEQFENEVYNFTENKYKVLGKYINNMTKILMKHNECGYEFEVTPGHFINGTRCPKCSHKTSTKKRTKTHEQFVQEVYNSVGNEYEILEKYKGARTKLLMKHKICNYEFKTEPTNFLSNNRRCPKCSAEESGKKQAKTHGQFIKEVYKLVGNEYVILEKYKNSSTKILTKHNVCGYEWEVVPSYLLCGHRCPKCAGVIHKTTQEFKKEIYKLVGDEYTVISEYKNAKTKVMVKHNKCGYEYCVNPSGILNGSRCPKCNESHGEIAIRRFLDSKGLTYIPQYRFDDCKDKKPLPFDFAVIAKNGDMILIEYDGEQHTKVVEIWGGEEALKCIQNRDRIKTTYCIIHNIPLIRIPYTIKNIETFLDYKLLHINEYEKICFDLEGI